MSLYSIIARIEEERRLNQTLLTSLLEATDAEIQRLEERKSDLQQEFAERDASLLRIIEDEPRLPVPAKVVEAA